MIILFIPYPPYYRKGGPCFFPGRLSVIMLSIILLSKKVCFADFRLRRVIYEFTFLSSPSPFSRICSSSIITPNTSSMVFSS